jgi:carboxypeptidase Taq
MSAYAKLCDLNREISLLGSIDAVLGWDQETYMPARGLGHRARQLAYLSGKAHALSTSARMRKLLDQAEAEGAEGERAAANLTQWRRQVERASKIPAKLVTEETEVTAHAKAAWADARGTSDFSRFAPHLEKVVAMARRKAELWGFEDEPYDALLVNYERGACTREVAALFDHLKPELTGIAGKAVARSARRKTDILRGRFPIEKQQILNREVAESLGFDFAAGRIDTTAHPFCTTLGPDDVRLTTRYDERDFTSSLFGVMHEAGHGLYEQGLVSEDFGLPSGQAVSLGIHESQSRLWENHVGRSLPFWKRWFPRAQELFPGLRKVKLREFMNFVHRSEFSFIRVEADEATYDLHILLRFDIERRLVRGELAVQDVPQAWNESFEELFGLVPPDDAHGCLQDIHWSMGGLGYFATYSLGNLNAAQLFAKAMKRASISDAFARADYGPLLKWLKQKVHQPGGTYDPPDLMRRATGKPTDAKWHLAHLRQRFVA